MSTIPESHRDLLDGQVVILGTIGPGGEPQTTALWFVYKDGELGMSINNARQKTKNLFANPTASLFFIDLQNPYRTLELRGTVTIEPDLEYVHAEKVKEKYGADVREMDQPGEVRSWVTLSNIQKVHAFGQ